MLSALQKNRLEPEDICREFSPARKELSNKRVSSKGMRSFIRQQLSITVKNSEAEFMQTIEKIQMLGKDDMA